MSAEALYPSDYILLQGVWTDPVKGHRYTFTPAAPRHLRFSITSIATGAELARGELAPQGERDMMVGEFTTGPANVPKRDDNSGEVNFSVDRLGHFYVVVTRGNLLGESRETSSNSSRPQITREVTLAQDVQQAWIGQWQTSRGLVDFEAIGGDVIAAYIPSERDRDGPLGGGTIPRGVDLALLAGASDAYGSWQQLDHRVTLGDAVLRLAPDGKSFSGYYTDVTTSGDRIQWTGTRATADSTITPLPAEVVARYAGDWHSVEDGRMQILRQGPGAVLSLRLNGKPVTLPLYLSPDGHSLEGSVKLYRLSGSTPFRLVFAGNDESELIGRHREDDGSLGRPVWRFTRTPNSPSTPSETAPGQPAPGGTPPGGSAPQPGPVGTPPSQPVPQPGPVGTPPQVPPVVTGPGPALPGSFKPLNRIDVRLDRVEVARGYPTHQVHAFMTVKNSSAAPQYFTSGFMKVFLADADGAGQERSQPYRASVEPAALFNATPVIQPGGELKVRYIFTPGLEDQLTSLTVTEGEKQATFAVSGF